MLMKTQQIKKYTLVILLAGVIFTSFSFKSNFFEVAKQIEIYTTLFKELNMYYVNEINPAEFTNKAIKNTLKDLDPYTNYYDEQEVEQALIRREGEYGGIGVSVFYDSRGIIISEIYKGYEADKKGLKAGDIITKADNQSLQNLDRDYLSGVLSGSPNTSINLEVLRKGEKKYIKVTREKVVYNPVPFFDMIDKETGYIVLTRFNQKASAEVKKAFLSLKEEGMKNLVFDLRGNPGGSLGEAINISNFFLPKGSTIVSTKAKVKKWSNTYRASKNPLDSDIPITVLINGRSASASEIVAGALQDYDRAVILGERSFGKGLVQRYRELSYGTQLKVTISKYYTPSGRCIQELDYANRDEHGVVPKFSDGKVVAFKTKNGRTVYDGGGVMPDIEFGYQSKNKATEYLEQSRAIFDFATAFWAENKSIDKAEEFKLNPKEFKKFESFLINKDTTFKTEEELLFEEAFNKTQSKSELKKSYDNLTKKINDIKLEELSENENYISDLIKDEILLRYYYKEGVYQNKIKNDELIKEALKVLQDKKKYANVLSIK